MGESILIGGIMEQLLDKAEEIRLIFGKLDIPEEYVEKFVEETVWIEIWPELKDRDVDELIDKIGYRIRFKRYIKSL